MTPGCKGCEAFNRGVQGNHNDRCRLRIEKAILEDPDRYLKVLTKLTEHKMDEKGESSASQATSNPKGDGDIEMQDESAQASNGNASNATH